MNIPPFPSQDLAKLVLGYLAEEQLMTAYDEFLQASPYLDALRNEYDRIFMTSLKNILAEYRAVKIYVETCKPIALRRKLFQCTNLLDSFKLLISFVDLNKVNVQCDTTDRNSVNKNTTPPKSIVCDVCKSLEECVCKDRNDENSSSATNAESNASESSVETTLLTDLPGNHDNHVTTRRKNVKTLEKDSTSAQSSSSSSRNSNELVVNSDTHHVSINSFSMDTHDCETNPLTQHTTVISTDQSVTQKEMSKRENHSSTVDNLHSKEASTGTLRGAFSNMCTTSTFGEFASGVTGGDYSNNNVPDSSTSENLNIPVPTSTKELNIEPRSQNLNESMKCQYLVKVGNVTNTLGVQSCTNSSKVEEENGYYLTRNKQKPDDSRIKILSDVKFGRNKNIKAGAATSTPLTQMKTIVINGTQAYRHNSLGHPQNFTKDEIMAMPTIIVVPAASGPGNVPKKSQTQSSGTKKSKVSSITSSTTKAKKRSSIKPVSATSTEATSSTTPLLGPLVIDVSSSPVSAIPNSPGVNKNTQPSLIKTVDVIKTASMPKVTIANSLESCTPQVLPPVRKSSSTPRRSSHVRVLDFTTPRRILHETIHERAGSQNSDAPAEVVLSSSPNIGALDLAKCNTISTTQNQETNTSLKCSNDQNESAKENKNDNKVHLNKKQSWDADLRALLTEDETSLSTKSTSKIKNKTNRRRKSAKLSKSRENETGGDSTLDVKKTPKPRRSQKRVKCEEEDSECVAVASETTQPVKPNIKIISKPNWGTVSVEEEPKDNKDVVVISPIVDDHIDTPETDRVSLQNIIGAKLNISELLETPYKQALYDIQMETPKFFGSDLPDYPMSDVKIMNIPTPRFLDTPKPVQATPSSYSSRPTDYSSGGSYYKPDEQDYAPAPDLSCKISPSTDEPVNGQQNLDEQTTKKVSTRPVRQCTKNVSYYKNLNANSNKTKEIDDSVSSCSDSVNVQVPCESKNYKEEELKTPKIEKQNQIETNKSMSKKRSSTTKKRKSPANKVKSNTFMKIKPRRPTPVKQSKSNKSYTSKSPLKYQIKKRNSIKEKGATNLIVSAPTKSRRKSSTPRKINCTKTFNSESSGHNSPEIISDTYEAPSEAAVINHQDSDTEQIALRWSDDGSQDMKPKPIGNTISESDDISKIQEYIEFTAIKKKDVDVKENIKDVNNETSLQADLIKRGFDIETAKSIERDLLDTPPRSNNRSLSQTLPEAYVEKINEDLRKLAEPDSGDQIEKDCEIDDEIELSVHECNEESENYVVLKHDYAIGTVKKPDVKLKDKFSMEVCIDDGVAIRLRATPFEMLFDRDPECIEELNYSYRETVVAVNSICTIDRLYTPIKDPVRAQCYEIFDSTLTSIDTPIKEISSIDTKSVNMEINLKEERTKETVDVTNMKDNVEAKKRKRAHSGNGSDESSHENTNKKAKSKTQYLLNSANIQNIDIESVLKKLHGP